MIEIFPIMAPQVESYRWPSNLRNAGILCVVTGLPWTILAPHEAQAMKNHSQTLKTLAGRGGLSASEALAVIEDRSWCSMPEDEAHTKLACLVLAASKEVGR